MSYTYLAQTWKKKKQKQKIDRPPCSENSWKKIFLEDFYDTEISKAMLNTYLHIELCLCVCAQI